MLEKYNKILDARILESIMTTTNTIMKESTSTSQELSEKEGTKNNTRLRNLALDVRVPKTNSVEKSTINHDSTSMEGSATINEASQFLDSNDQEITASDV